MVNGFDTVKNSVFVPSLPVQARGGLTRPVLLAFALLLLALSIAGCSAEESEVSQDKPAQVISASKVDKDDIDVDKLVIPNEKLPMSTLPQNLTRVPGSEEGQHKAAGTASSLDLSLPKELYSDDLLIDDAGNPVVGNTSQLGNLFEQKKKKDSNLSITGKPLFRTVDGPITRDSLIDQVDGASLNVEIKN